MLFKYSIIIPHYNNEAGLKRCLRHISLMKTDSLDYEVIVVDNGSDEIPSGLCDIFDFILITEDFYLSSPYSCRNRGFERATGNIYVLLDSTCAPDHNWLIDINSNILNFDLAGGEVVFNLGENPSYGMIYDSLFNVNMKSSIINNHCAKGGNLIIKKNVVESLGLFEEGLRSGGDVTYTRLAYDKGFNLKYLPNSIVYIEPRGFLLLSKKTFRVAKGMPHICLTTNSSLFNLIIKKMVFCFVPLNPFYLIKLMKKNDIGLLKNFIPLFLIGYTQRVITGFGITVGIFKRFLYDNS